MFPYIAQLKNFGDPKRWYQSERGDNCQILENSHVNCYRRLMYGGLVFPVSVAAAVAFAVVSVVSVAEVAADIAVEAVVVVVVVFGPYFLLADNDYLYLVFFDDENHY